MKRLLTGVALAMLATGALAQSSAPVGNENTSSNDAIKDPVARNTAAPAEGANSFTERQAQRRIAKAGYSQVSALTKDDSGVWQGTAKRNGKSVQVALDYKGNVTSK